MATRILQKLKKDYKTHKYVYIMMIPVLAYYIIFHYGPIYGLTIAFKNFKPMLGIMKSPWIGFGYFTEFFSSYYFFRLIRNTLAINFLQLLFGFPIPIIFALLLNELKFTPLKKAAQTITYLPHFISTVVICGLIIDFTETNGLINDLLVLFGNEKRQNLLSQAHLFRGIFVSSNIWQEFGWGSIIYLAALSGIDPQLYEAAIIDGANRWKQTLKITLPCITPTIVILLIMRIGRLMSLGWEKVILLYNPLTYETADVISSFVYRRGLLEFDYSYSAAVGLFNSLINFLLLILANQISRKVNETSLW